MVPNARVEVPELVWVTLDWPKLRVVLPASVWAKAPPLNCTLTPLKVRAAAPVAVVLRREVAPALVAL